LTVDEARGFITTSLDDDSLQLLLDAAEDEITRYAGDPDTATEWFGGGQHQVVLSRQAERIVSVSERGLRWSTDETTLETDDYELDPFGVTIYRLVNGTNSRYRWFGRVAVTYVPADESAIRKSVQIDLANLMVTFAPGVTSETVGSWTRQLGGNASWQNSSQRNDILSRLRPYPAFVVVGGN